MKFRHLQENLRKALWRRIEHGDLTGLRLAQQTGFKQAHMSNFLNRKRRLSLDGMDKVLAVQHLSVLDLLEPAEVNKRASIPPPSEDEFENVFVVDGEVAAVEPLIMSMKVLEIEKFRRSFLRRLRPQMQGKRAHWERFVVVKVEPGDGMAMYPRLLPGARALLDRHYNSLVAYRKGETNMYGVRLKGGCAIRYAELAGETLVLRPLNQAYPVEVVPLQEGETPGDYLVGRICHVGIET